MLSHQYFNNELITYTTFYATKTLTHILHSCVKPILPFGEKPTYIIKQSLKRVQA